MKKIVKVEGMHCNHCTAAVEAELMKLDKVKEAKADLAKNQVVVTLKEEISDEILSKSVVEAGFTPGEITTKKGIFG